MADTGEKKYDIKESLNRILRVLIGVIAPNDAPGTLAGSILSIDEALSKLAEVLEGNDPEETFTLPNNTDVANLTITDSILLEGDGTVWDDLRFPALALRVPPAGASAEPDLVQFRDNNDSSTGVFSYAFDAATEEEMYFAIQMPHSWAGTPISPHVHWAVMAGTTGTVGWGMEYTWAELSGTFAYTALIAANQNYLGEDNLVAYRHYLTGLPDITGTFGSGTISSMLVGRIFRDAGASLVADSCPQDAVLLELDFHYEIDRLGSDQEYVR